ncbi:magnesium transporter [Mycolicibacterium peregrinum]|uniref:Magnesium transporter n=1 Tax=Mycolicibacterium peregrinum TaxID=43304 RepID=A0A1A0VLW9_MYCPR|nr:magnesium transporter [Mycolicibacterium peregrinum]
MLLLTEMVGRDVIGDDGGVLGRLTDATVRLGSDDVVVDRLVVHAGNGRGLLLLWAEGAAFQHRAIRLASTSSATTRAYSGSALEADEIQLVRDVLDTQVVDITGQRLARVADVVLARRHDGRIQPVGVEVGFGAVLRRLGLGRLVSRLPPDTVAWADVHLTSERGHAVQLATPRATMHLLDARGLAGLVARLDTGSATEILVAKGPLVAADVIRASHAVTGERMLRAMSESEAADVIEAMPEHHRRRWRERLAHRYTRHNRPLLRSHVWPRRHHRATDSPR